MFDPGLSLKATTLPAAWHLFLQTVSGAISGEPAPAKGIVPDTISMPEDAAEAIEAMAVPAGLRSRRVLLAAAWWRHAGGAMIARVSERRRVPRGPTPMTSPSLAAGTGWVALVADLGGYRMRATDPESGRIVEWRVDEAVASRLSPF